MFSISLTIVALLILAIISIAGLRYTKSWLVKEDSVAVTVNRDGFINRILPAGRHTLRLFEKVDFVIETKTKLVANRVMTVATKDGILINVDWSGTYMPRPELITENLGQRLRGLSNAEKAISRNTDICLRKLAGDYPVSDLFNPAIRERIERRLSQLLADRLKPLGIVFNGLNLQVIDLPREVSDALNKAKAIETLDGAIRQLDPTTREVVRGAYQLDEILHWDAYLPTPSRLTLKRMQESMAY